MIGTLHIKNVGIIDDLEVNLNEGFNVFTGETGAGKTLIIDSLQILAGGRFSKEIIRHGEKSSYIEMIVYLENEEYLISREVHISGRNICKINGRLTTVNELKTFMKKVIDIHGQQDNQTILESASHIKFVDDYIGKELEEIKNKYLEKYNRYITIKEELKKNYGDDKEKQRKLDLLNYQYNEIEEANLKENEETNLDEKLKKILNSEKIKNNLEEAHYSLEEGILSELSNVLRAIEKISDYDNEYNKCREIIQNAYYDLEEVEKDLYNYKENAYFDEEERINIEQRIDLIQDLKRKYGNNIEEILEYQKDVKEQIETIENLSDYIEQIKNEKTEIEKELQELSTKMHDLRQIYSNKMSEQINTELQDLEMRNARFYVQIENREEFNINGKDNIEFLISTNIGEEKKPLIKIASGGEMSRIMLGIKKVLADIDQVPVLIFDEIDTGISGIAAKKVGIKMKEISKKHQVICVTHLAQIAAKGDYNYFIKKEVKDNKTNTKIEQLTEEGTIREIARIATGEINEISLKQRIKKRKSCIKINIFQKLITKKGLIRMENNNLNVLDEINKGATMGMDAIDIISDKTKDADLKETLKVEYNKYKKISERVNDIYSHYHTNKEPHETNAMNKMMTWYGVQMRTIKDDTPSKLSELLMQGTNMGIIEGRRLLNHNTRIDKDIKNVLNDFVVMQEDSIETLKKFL